MKRPAISDAVSLPSSEPELPSDCEDDQDDHDHHDDNPVDLPSDGELEDDSQDVQMPSEESSAAHEESNGDHGENIEPQIPIPQVVIKFSLLFESDSVNFLLWFLFVVAQSVRQVANRLRDGQFFAEYYSRPRVAPVAARLMGCSRMSCLLSLDLLTGWDFTKPEVQA